jgi:hypothetical protein
MAYRVLLAPQRGSGYLWPRVLHATGHFKLCDCVLRCLLGTALTDDFPTEASQEPHASCDAAFSCLLQLNVQSGVDLGFGRGDCRNVVDGDTLSISRLVELVGELGFKAEHARLDWRDLQKAGFSHPILIVLKNTNVIVVTGGGRDGASEVAVWDPADRYGKILFVPREDFERASSGHAVIITPPPSNGTGASPSLDFCWYTTAGLELLKKTSTRGQNLTLPARPRKESGAQLKPRIEPRRWNRAIARGMRDKPLLVRKGIESEQLSPAIADVAQSPSPASSRSAVARRVFPLARVWLAATGIVIAAGISVAVQRVPVTDPVAATIGVIREFPEIALSKALSISKAAVRDVSSRIEGDPRIEPVPLLAAPPTAPAGEPSPVAPPAAAASEPSPAAPPAAAASEPSPAAPPAAAASEPSLVAPRDAIVATTASKAETTTRPTIPEDAAALLARGDRLLSIGDVTSARLFYERAVDGGAGLAAVRLGETYDPVFLDRIHLRGVRADRGLALFWYRRARDLGATDAEVLLRALETK